jgi:hypothetical protein
MSSFGTEEMLLAKKPKPVGWMVAGLMGLGLAALGLGYYMPLLKAHTMLIDAHDVLAKKAAGLDGQLRTQGSSLSETTARRDALERVLSEAAEKESAFSQKAASVRSGLESALAKLVQAKQATLRTAGPAAVAVTPQNLLFRPQSEKTLPFASKFACTVAKALPKSSGAELVVNVLASDAASLPAAAARAGSLAQVLVESCHVDAAQVRAMARAGSEEVVEVTVSPGEAPRLQAESIPR